MNLTRPHLFVSALLVLGFCLAGNSRAQTNSNGTGGGNWMDSSTWSGLGAAPVVGDGPFTIVSGDTVTADSNFNFPDATTITVAGGATMSLDFSVGTPIDPANTVDLNGGTLTTAIVDPGATASDFNPGNNNVARGIHVTANSTLENRLNSTGGAGSVRRELEIGGGGLRIDPGATGAVKLTIDLNPAGTDNANRDRRIGIENGNYTGGADDEIQFTGNEAGDQFRIENGVDNVDFQGTIRALGGARYVVNKNGYTFNEAAIILGDGTGTSNTTRSDLLINNDNITLGSDLVTDNESAGRNQLADPAIVLATSSQGLSVSGTFDDYIGVNTDNANSNSSSELNLTAGTTVGGLTDLNNTPDQQTGGFPREFINVAPGDNAASVVTVTNDAILESVVLTFEATGNLTNDALDGASSGTIQLGLTGNQTPNDSLDLPTQLAIELDYAPSFGDVWDILINWNTIDNQFSEVITAPGSSFSLAPEHSYLFTLESGGTIGRVTVVPEPSKALLLSVGLLAATMRRRRA